MRYVVASDHTGIELKSAVCALLSERGQEAVDLGPDSNQSVDYPDYAGRVARAILCGDAERGVLICGTGQGMAIAANKIAGIRAAVVSDVFSAKMAVAHNDAQILCLGARVVGLGLAMSIVESFCDATFEGGRHQRRLDKIASLEARAS